MTCKQENQKERKKMNNSSYLFACFGLPEQSPLILKKEKYPSQTDKRVWLLNKTGSHFVKQLAVILWN